MLLILESHLRGGDCAHPCTPPLDPTLNNGYSKFNNEFMISFQIDIILLSDDSIWLWFAGI